MAQPGMTLGASQFYFLQASFCIFTSKETLLQRRYLGTWLQRATLHQVASLIQHHGKLLQYSPTTGYNVFAKYLTVSSCKISEAEEPTAPLPLKSHLQAAKGHPITDPTSRTFGVKQDPVGGTKTLSGFKSFDNSGQREICPPPARNRSILSAFFPRNKTLKPKRVLVS
ncbi:hypothetical protein BHM03_00049438 [Ensete ventricosum]|nr:hypothetical protein BHM03_00049438 [Ensete ventricosum]